MLWINNNELRRREKSKEESANELAKSKSEISSLKINIDILNKELYWSQKRESDYRREISDLKNEITSLEFSVIDRDARISDLECEISLLKLMLEKISNERNDLRELMNIEYKDVTIV